MSGMPSGGFDRFLSEFIKFIVEFKQRLERTCDVADHEIASDLRCW